MKRHFASTIDPVTGTATADISIVLLENHGDLLPLSPQTRRIAVLGPCSDDIRLLQGDYHYPAHAEITYIGLDADRPDVDDILPRSSPSAFAPGPYPVAMVSLVEGIRDAVSASTDVLVARGCDISGDDESGFAEALAAAESADVAIVALRPSYGFSSCCINVQASRQARSTGDLRGPNIHSASSRRTHHDSAFESAPVTHTACLRHVHYTGSDSFP